MNAKLTLRLNKETINRIKIFAEIKHKSISKITEGLYTKLLESENTDKLSPVVKKYKGILKGKLNNETDEIIEYLHQKHG